MCRITALPDFLSNINKQDGNICPFVLQYAVFRRSKEHAQVQDRSAIGCQVQTLIIYT